MIFDVGPFRLYRVQGSGTLCISLICLDDRACGWEWGWEDYMRDPGKPIIEFRIGKLMIAYLEIWKTGCTIWFLGFWGMPSWGKRRDK